LEEYVGLRMELWWRVVHFLERKNSDFVDIGADIVKAAVCVLVGPKTGKHVERSGETVWDWVFGEPEEYSSRWESKPRCC